MLKKNFDGPFGQDDWVLAWSTGNKVLVGPAETLDVGWADDFEGTYGPGTFKPWGEPSPQELIERLLSVFYTITVHHGVDPRAASVQLRKIAPFERYLESNGLL